MEKIKKGEADKMLRSMMLDLEAIVRKYDIELDGKAKTTLYLSLQDEIHSSFDVYDC